MICQRDNDPIKVKKYQNSLTVLYILIVLYCIWLTIKISVHMAILGVVGYRSIEDCSQLYLVDE